MIDWIEEGIRFAGMFIAGCIFWAFIYPRISKDKKQK